MARASGTNLAGRLSFGATSVSPSRTGEGQYYHMAGLNLLAAIVIHWNASISAKRSDSGNTPG